MDRIEISAPAKINLFLKVLGKRDDGYHNIYSWFQAVNLFDYLIFARTEKPGFNLEIEGASNLPEDENNLVVKTARVLFKKFNLKGGLEIRLKKNIPIAAGLAGGSSDSAATIYAINRMFDLRLGNAEMQEIGLQIGSDIPFFFSSGQAEVTGRGEKIENISLPLDYAILLATPDLEISTADSYCRLRLGLTSFNENINLFSCNDFKALVTGVFEIGNDFEKIHLESFPVLRRIKDGLESTGAVLTRMSGSGPTMFGLFENMPEGSDLHQINHGDWQLFSVQPITLPAWDQLDV